MNRVVARGRLAHAYLFYGPEGVGKLTVAKALARALHCKNAAGQEALASACGTCTDCRAIEADTHPQVLMLDLAHTLVSKKEDRKEIPIEDIRELKRVLALSPEGDKLRIAIVSQADTMSDEGANALLKLLEEPGSRTLLILITAALDLLLPTVISRTHAMRFSEVSEKKIAEFLERKGMNQEEVRAIAARATGRPGRAIRLSEDKANWDAEKKFFSQFQSALNAGIPQMFAFSQRVSGDPQLRPKVAEEIIRTLHGRLRSADDARNIAGLIKKIYEADRIAELLATTNVNPRLAIDAMFLSTTQ